MNIKRHIIGSAWMLIAATGFHSCNLKDPLDGVQVVVNNNFIKTQMAVSFVDAATGLPIERGVALTLIGEDKKQIVNIGGRPEFDPQQGIITLALKQGVRPTESHPISFTLSAHAAGYVTTYQPIEVKADGMYMYEIKMTNIRNLPNGATQDAGVIVDNQITVSNKRSSSALKADTYTYELIRYYGSEQALNTLPLPAVSSANVLTPLIALHLTIKQQGTEVGRLENPITVTLPNPSALPAGTILHLFSYDNTSGKWTNEPTRATVSNDGKSLSFVVTKIAYYWAIGTAYTAESAKTQITSKAAGNDVYTFSYYMNGQYAGSQQMNVMKGTSQLQTMAIPQGASVRITNYAGKVLYNGTPANISLSNESTNVISFILKATCDTGDIGVKVIPSTILYFREVGTSIWRTTTVQSGSNQLSDIQMGASYEVMVNYDGETYTGELVPNEHITGQAGSAYEFDFELPDDFC